MKVTVCELNDEAAAFAQDWERLAAHVRAEKSDLVLLPELPFHPWFALERQFDEACWQEVVEAHETWMGRLAELAPAVVLGTRPVNRGNLRLNEGFAWDVGQGYRAVHEKYYLPDDPGFWEASWYQRGNGDFTPVQCGPAKLGFLICTELWFMERGRLYGKQGVHILANPRSTERGTVDKWLAGGRACAVVSGAFCLSSNHVGLTKTGTELGGCGWIIGPDGDVRGVTSSSEPFLTLEIDLSEAERARQTYPRYVAD